ncbi:MAG TPA: CBS domain-containing protein [archaeon]|nr:CBS domain-containing protein [archaeon]
MPLLVKDIMSKPVVTIEDTKSAKDAGILMKKTRKGCLIITKSKKPVGILSDSDLIKRVVAENLKASKVKLSKIMSKPLVVVKIDDDVLVAARKMRRTNIHRLPVVDKDKVVGIVSLSDIARSSPEMVDLLEFRLKMKEGPYTIEEEMTSGICDSCGNYADDLKSSNDQWVCEDCREETEQA